MESKLYILEENEMKNRLEEIRKERGIRQEELARALEVSRQTIGSLENGRYNPSILLAFKRSEERRVGKECRSRWSPYH